MYFLWRANTLVKWCCIQLTGVCKTLGFILVPNYCLNSTETGGYIRLQSAVSKHAHARTHTLKAIHHPHLPVFDKGNGETGMGRSRLCCCVLIHENSDVSRVLWDILFKAMLRWQAAGPSDPIAQIIARCHGIKERGIQLALRFTQSLFKTCWDSFIKLI